MHQGAHPIRRLQQLENWEPAHPLTWLPRALRAQSAKQVSKVSLGLRPQDNESLEKVSGTFQKSLLRHFPETLPRLPGLFSRLFADFSWSQAFGRLFCISGERPVRSGLVPSKKERAQICQHPKHPPNPPEHSPPSPSPAPSLDHDSQVAADRFALPQ